MKRIGPAGSFKFLDLSLLPDAELQNTTYQRAEYDSACKVSHGYVRLLLDITAYISELK